MYNRKQMPDNTTWRTFHAFLIRVPLTMCSLHTNQYIPGLCKSTSVKRKCQFSTQYFKAHNWSEAMAGIGLLVYYRSGRSIAVKEIHMAYLKTGKETDLRIRPCADWWETPCWEIIRRCDTCWVAGWLDRSYTQGTMWWISGIDGIIIVRGIAKLLHENV
jgi:hypothetical protein